MRKPKRNRALFLSFPFFNLVLPFSLLGINVVVDIPPQVFLVERIAGKHIEVEILIPQRGDPHTFELDFSQLEKLSKAEAFFAMGIEAEEKIKKRLTDLNKKIKIFETQKGIPLRHYRSHEGKGKDPHFWLDPSLFKIQAENIFLALSKLDRKNEPIFEKNLKILIKELERLDKNIRHTLEPYRGRAIFVYHPAFGYFTDAYGLIQIPFEFAHLEVPPKRAIEFMEKARKEGATFILTTPQSQTKNAKEIANNLNIQLFLFDPLEKDYIKNLERLSFKIEEGLKRRR